VQQTQEVLRQERNVKVPRQQREVQLLLVAVVQEIKIVFRLVSC
jgi:hypothetical protein